METKNPPPKKPKPLLDKDGNPVVNKFGHITTAPLTKEEKQAIDELAAKGTTRKAICEQVGVSYTRLKNYLEEPARAQAIALMAYTQTVAQDSKETKELIARLLDIIMQMESRVSDIQTELRQVKKAAQRQKLGRAQAEKESRSQRQQINELKRYIHKRTGRKL
jgi:hypothetical protein